jgi:signal transduction histidine kinase
MKNAVTGRCRCRCFLFFLIWLFSLSLTGSAQTNLADAKRVTLTEAEKAWMQRHPVVHWGVDPHWPPFSKIDEHGQITGIDAELIQLLTKRTGLNIQLVRTMTWSETYEMAKVGQIDFVSGFVKTQERLNGFNFTRPYGTFPLTIITRKDSPFLTSISQLSSNRIAAPRDYAVTARLMDVYPDTKFLLTDNAEQAMLMVAGNEADATVETLAIASYVVHMRGLSNLKISGLTHVDLALRLGVRKDLPELVSILDKGLATIDAKEQEEIYARYILPETLGNFKWRLWRQRLIYSILAGAGAVAAVLIWNRRLAHEIEQRKHAEKELREAGEDLERQATELKHHSREMSAMNENLTNANKDLESFSYSVSHDLKSPLRRLRSFLDILEEDAGPTLNKPGRESLAIITMEARKMTELINDLLIYGRIGRTDMRLAPTNLRPLIDEVIRNLEPELKHREVDWKIDPLPDVMCDPGLLRQALANLIDNAVKFTRGRKPARIEIGVLPSKSDDKEVTFYIKDNGSGFDMQYASSLFEPFQRLHTQEEFEGTGVGLANVHRIIRRHGGRVWAEAATDKGATFYFTLKRAPQ